MSTSGSELCLAIHGCRHGEHEQRRRKSELGARESEAESRESKGPTKGGAQRPLLEGRSVGHAAAALSHGGGILHAWRPRGQNDEHLVGDHEGEVES
jgi:hypothetical protein